MLQQKKVTLVSSKENIDTNTPQGRFVLSIFAALSELEREQTLQRQREGIAIAKEKGVYKGRKPVSVSKEVFNEQYARYQKREINKGELAKILNVSRPTLDKLIVEYTA